MSAKAETALSNTTGRAAVIFDWLDNAGDRLNPIVLKEIRQMVRGREFNYSFTLCLAAGLIAAFVGASGAVYGAESSGVTIFSVLMSLLRLVGLGVAPLATFSALRSEQTDQTLDLIALTELSPRRIVVGPADRRLGW